MQNQKRMINQYINVFKLVYRLEPRSLIFAILYSLGNTLLPYLNLLFLGMLLNLIAGNASSTVLFQTIFLYVSSTLVLSLFTNFFKKLRDQSEHHLSLTLQSELTQRLLTIDYAELDDPEMRKNYQRAVEGANYNGGLYSFIIYFVDGLIKVITAVMISTGTLVSLFLAKTNAVHALASWTNSTWYSLSLAILIMFPLISAVIFSSAEGKIYKQMFEDVVGINRWFSYIVPMLRDLKNNKMLRLYQGTEYVLEQVRQVNRESLKVFNRTFKQAYYLSGSANFISSLTLACLYFFIGLKAIVGAIGIGFVLTYVGYFQQFILALQGFLTYLGNSHTIVDYLQYYYEFLYSEQQGAKGTLPIEKRNDNDYEIEFKRVSFKYPRSDDYILIDFSLKLKVGERLAVVGKNGSGKTTFIKLLCRLYEPTSGMITLNGIDINKYDLAEYHSLLAVVFQDFKLFSFSVAENVAANKQPDQEHVHKALQVAGIENRVNEMPQGIETTLTKYLDSNGVELSGGESQKIGIARAWYKNSPFVILDEPTSALDPIAEYEVYKRFDELIEDKTAIYISHRMSSTRFSERIVVFDEGKITQTGGHAELITTAGLYQDLFNAQAKYYREQEGEMS